MCRVSTAPVATAGRSGLNWKKFSLSMRSASQYSRARFDRPIERTTSSPAKPPPSTRSRFRPMDRAYHCVMTTGRSAPALRNGAARPPGALRALGAMTAVGVALALVPACDAGRRSGGEGPAAPAETLIERTARARVSRLWFEGRGDLRTRATLRVPRGARPRSLACVVIAGGHEHGWTTAEYLDAGPGVAVLSIDYPYDGPRRSIPRDRIAEVIPKIWSATRDMGPLLREAGAYAARRPEIDSTRILIVGASLGVPFAL